MFAGLDARARGFFGPKRPSNSEIPIAQKGPFLRCLMSKYLSQLQQFLSECFSIFLCFGGAEKGLRPAALWRPGGTDAG